MRFFILNILILTLPLPPIWAQRTETQEQIQALKLNRSTFMDLLDKESLEKLQNSQLPDIDHAMGSWRV